MTNSIFPPEAQGLHATPWNEWLEELTPVERHGGVWVKREDMFAPLGYGGINGSKLRGCILIMEQRSQDSELVVTGASVKSPQHSMTAAVAQHLGMRTLHIIGGTKPESAMQRIQVRLGARFGAKYLIVPVGYNTALQSAVKRWAGEYGAGTMPYGISPEPFEMQRFHALGGLQTSNLPDVHTLIVPAGSCNTLASVLYGLSMQRPASLRRVVTVGIGPDRLRWVWERLAALNCREGFRYNLPSCLKRDPVERNYLEIVHVDPHGEKFCDYQGEMKENLGEIVLHPTYEGKVLRYLKQRYPHLLTEDSCFWIVGGPASEEAMLPHLLPTPKELPEWTF